MAITNPNAPFGFRPTRHLTGGGNILSERSIASGLAETIALDDLVKSDGAGGIRKAATGDAFLGVFKGVQYTRPDGKHIWSKVWVTGTVTKPGTRVIANVQDDPFETYEVQTSATIVAADIGQFVDLVDAAPDQTYGCSRQTVGGAGGTQFRIERILEKAVRVPGANNDTTGYGLSVEGQYALIEVTPVKHERGGPAMAVAV